MPLTSASTEQDALDQYYDNIDGWRGNASAASAALGAMDWLMLRHSFKQLSDQGSELVTSDVFKTMYEKLNAFVNASTTSRPPMFARTRVTGMGSNP